MIKIPQALRDACRSGPDCKCTLNEAADLIDSQQSRIADLERQLAESQAREKKLKSALLIEALRWRTIGTKSEIKDEIELLFPSNDTALREAIEATKAEEREARIKAQTELAECREACLRAEHAAKRAQGELANEVKLEREDIIGTAEILLHSLVVSKYATAAECSAARKSVQRLIEAINNRSKP